jgi:hypothetical protein
MLQGFSIDQVVPAWIGMTKAPRSCPEALFGQYHAIKSWLCDP